MRYRERFLFTMEAINLAASLTGKIKGHYLNVTGATMEDIYERSNLAYKLSYVISNNQSYNWLFCYSINGKMV